MIMQVTWSLVAGGAEMYAFTIARGLDPARYRVFMCAIDQGGALEPEVKASRIPYRIMNRKPGIDLKLMWRMYRLFRETGATVIQTHHFNQLFYSFIGAKLTGAKILHTEHSIEVYKQRRFRIALRLLSIFCEKVIAIGSEGAGVLTDQVGIPKRKVLIMRAGVDVAKFNESRSDARSTLGLSEGDRVITIVARLYPEKNHILLLNAFKQVMNYSGDFNAPGSSRGHYRLLIAGEGTQRQRISDEIARLGLQDSVQLMGVRRDVATLLVASDVFVLSSDREGLPIAVLEAMAAGIPVVATAVGDLPSVVEDSVTGRVVPPGDANAMAAAISDILSDPDRAREMGQRGREIAASKYSLQATINQYEKLLQ